MACETYSRAVQNQWELELFVVFSVILSYRLKLMNPRLLLVVTIQEVNNNQFEEMIQQNIVVFEDSTRCKATSRLLSRLARTDER